MSMLTTLLSEISDTKRKMSKTITQQLFLVDRALINDIIGHQQSTDKLKAGLYLNKIREQLAEVRQDINNRLIPHMEELGQEDRLKVIKDISASLDRLDLINAKG